jgi:hypothetical protein
MPNQSKFEGIDFSQLPIERLTPELLNLGQGFRCVRGEFVTYWKQGRIAREADAKLCHCWVVRIGDSLAGYITLLADKLQVEEPILLEESVKYRTFPAVKIGLLVVVRVACRRQSARQRIGTSLGGVGFSMWLRRLCQLLECDL